VIKKCSSDKSSFGFDKFAASSSHDTSTSRTVFVKPKISETNGACLDKGKNAIVYDHVKVESKIPVKKHSKFRFIPTCHHCGIIGHIRPNCCQLKSQSPWNKDASEKEKDIVEPSMFKYVTQHRKQHFQRFIPTCHHCGKIGHTRPNCFKLKPREHMHENYRTSFEGLCNMMRNVLTMLDKLDKGHNTAHRVKEA
jgi:hypothetical protein